MPIEPWHRSKNVHNLKVSSHLRVRNPEFVDWEVTSIFYAAVQLVDAYIAKNDPANFPDRHYKRNLWIQKNLSTIHPTYMKLFALSQASRYDTDMTEFDRTDAMKWYNMIEPTLR
jgi:hypothetical protein